MVIKARRNSVYCSERGICADRWVCTNILCWWWVQRGVGYIEYVGTREEGCQTAKGIIRRGECAEPKPSGVPGC